MKFVKSVFLSSLWAIILILIVVVSCTDNRLKVDVSAVKVDIEIQRFEKDFFETELDSNRLSFLTGKYGSFSRRYIENIMEITYLQDPLLLNKLEQFRTNPTIVELFNAIDEAYPNTDDLLLQFEDAFKHYAYYFPEKNIPKINTFLSGLGYAIVADSGRLGIALDMYLGGDSKYYEYIQIPKYKRGRMQKDFIVPDAMMSWIITEFESPNEGNDLLGQLIFYGKMLYALNAMMPATADTLKIGYTAQQLEWCDDNELEIWTHFISNDLLYKRESEILKKYIGESPFINGFPEGSPGRIGHWIGWQIVKAYMNNNPEVSLQQLLETTDAQKILNASNYKPSR